MSAVTEKVFDEAQRRQAVSDVFYWMIHIAAGLSVTLGAKGLVGLLHRLRYGNDAPLP